MNLWNFLKPKNNLDEYAKNMQPLQPALTPIQMDMNGNMVENPNIQPERRVTLGDRAKYRVNKAGQALSNALFGKQSESTDNVNQINPLYEILTNQQNKWKQEGNLPEEAINAAGQGLNSGYKEIADFIDKNNILKPTTDEEIALAKEGKFNSYAPSITTSSNPRTGGIFRDFSGGYQENRFTPASLDNFGQNTLADGRNKGFAYRAGEALGSLTRFGESPLGRGLLVGGTIGALGGDPTAMLAFGASTSMMNQGNRMNDQLYRNTLKNDYGYSDEDLGQVRGYINKDTFNNIVNSNYKSNMNTYRNKKLDQDSYVKMVQNLEALHKSGQLSDEVFLMSLQNLNNQFMDANTYNISDVSSSNDTRKTDSQVEYTKAKTEDVRNPKPKVYITKREGHTTVDINHNSKNNSRVNTPSPLGKTGMVKVRRPDGQVGSIPADRLNEALNAGYVRV